MRQLSLLSWLGASLKTVGGESGEYSSSPSHPCASSELRLWLWLAALKEGGGLIFFCIILEQALVFHREIPWESAAVSL